MITENEQTLKFGWLVLGVIAGAIVGDVIAVLSRIELGYVLSATSAPTLLTWRLSGALVGFCISVIADRWTQQSPHDFFWVACLCFWVIDLLIREKFTYMAR